MPRFITTKADFTLRRKHVSGEKGTVYENDYTTINPMPNAQKGEYVIGDSNFVFTSRLGLNAQKKHVRGAIVPPPIGDGDAWTIDSLANSGLTSETKIRLKPNYTSIRDFACYGSAVKMIQGTINGVITDFPAEMYFSSEEIKIYGAEEGYSFDETKPVKKSGYMLYNDYGIDMINQNVQPANVYNQLRYLTLCGTSYVFIDRSGEEHDFVGFSVEKKASGTCSKGKSVWVDNLATVTMSFEDGISVVIDVFKDYEDDAMYYVYGEDVYGALQGCRIRPKKELVEKYFYECDDFTAVLLDRRSRPIYTATFDCPEETDRGIIFTKRSYTWPSINGGFNPDLNGGYYSYVESLIELGQFYDDYFTDNMWRSLTHEAIKTLDWTYVSDNGDEVEDMSKIDTSRIEPITKIYGRQFDDLKRYADGIKTVNVVTYDGKSNTPDYHLTDMLDNAGWETKTLNITSDMEMVTDTLYSGLTGGFTSSDADNDFIRRLKLNSSYMLGAKGTRKGLDSMLAMFGFTPEEYDIHEYVYVFSATTDQFPHFCDDTYGKEFSYPLAKDVSTINRYKINFDPFDPYGNYCGIPVAEISLAAEDETGGTLDYSYVVPWFSHGKNYDDGLYFQCNGGWGKMNTMDVNLEIASGVSAVSAWENAVPLYMETQARMKFAKDFDDLLEEAFSSSRRHDVFYVTDISKITSVYTPKNKAEEMALADASHYFVLENLEYNQYFGYVHESSEGEIIRKYGWRSITNAELQDANNTSAATLVLYLESIKDNTTGNNPHIGGGTYDDGMRYVSGMSEIFNYSLINKNFIGIEDDTCEKIKDYIFDADKEEDNRKCWFFTDDYNVKDGKGTNETIELREADVSDLVYKIRIGSEYPLMKNSGCTPEKLGYELADILSATGTSSQNESVDIGVNAGDYFFSGDSIYSRKSFLDTFDPEACLDTGATVNGTNGEAAANSVVNVKNIDIHFNLLSGKTYSYLEGLSDDEKEIAKHDFKKYIVNTVLPYLTQMIPATSILSFSFDDDENNVHPIQPDVVDLAVSGKFEQEDLFGLDVSGKIMQENIIKNN